MQAKNDVTKEEVQEFIAYDPETGIFVWKVARPRGVKAGRRADRDNQAGGYRKVHLNGRYYQASRLAWLLGHGHWPPDQVDHINGDRGDNRLANLRECSQSESMANVRRQKNNTTGFKGVSYVESQNGPNKFKATIKKDNQSIFLGWFKTRKEAFAARMGAAAAVHGRFARNE
jgi:hypothetical protein